MNNKERKQLLSKLDKFYKENNQNLIIDTFQVMENDDNDCVFEVGLIDGTYLFCVQNYKNFEDRNVYLRTYFHKRILIKTWDGSLASSTPIYMDRIFTLPKFTKITKDDIINCMNYFLREELKEFWMFWNNKFNEEKVNKEFIDEQKNILQKLQQKLFRPI